MNPRISAECGLNCPARLHRSRNKSRNSLLVGATTYNFFIEYLLESKEQADSFTNKIGSLSKYVVSTELKEAPWGVWEPATIIKDNVFEEITKLKEQSGKDIVIWGSMTLA